MSKIVELIVGVFYKKQSKLKALIAKRDEMKREIQEGIGEAEAEYTEIFNAIVELERAQLDIKKDIEQGQDMLKAFGGNK